MIEELWPMWVAMGALVLLMGGLLQLRRRTRARFRTGGALMAAGGGALLSVGMLSGLAGLGQIALLVFGGSELLLGLGIALVLAGHVADEPGR